MITESHYWKKPLLAGAKAIRKNMHTEDVSEAQFARIEREIFIGVLFDKEITRRQGKSARKRAI